MKITDEEREAAYELKWMVEGILFEREKAVLYRDVYMMSLNKFGNPGNADANARLAIAHMEKAFEPVCPQCDPETPESRVTN